MMCLTVAVRQMNQGTNPGDVNLSWTTNVTSAMSYAMSMFIYTN